MALVDSFYGVVLLLALIAAALAWLVSPTLGRTPAQRVIISFLLFVLSVMFRPGGSSGVSGGVRLLLSFVFFVASVLCLFIPGVLKTVLSSFGLALMAGIVFCTIVLPLWSSFSGRLVLVSIAVIGIGVVQVRRKNRQS